ncbi:MAG: hypothetical protein ACM31D_14580 [Bacteroidota bacterium]
MSVRSIAVLPLILALAGCAAADTPASPERLGRFMGLVAQCGCSNVSLDRMLADYPRVVASRHSPSEPDRLHGFIEVGGTENFSNQVPICAEVCSQTCAVNAVVLPLGGRPVGDGSACALTERGLNLTPGWTDSE